jgi:hypothetical protein
VDSQVIATGASGGGLAGPVATDAPGAGAGLPGPSGVDAEQRAPAAPRHGDPVAGSSEGVDRMDR